MQPSTSERQIVVSKQQYTPILTKFQCDMAFQTEKLKLDQQLVNKAIKYMHEHTELAFFLVGINPNAQKSKKLPIISSMMITQQNQKSWWIQSVFVEPEHRRKGNFKALLLKSIQLAKGKGVTSLKLYAEKENERAKTTYKSLGMNITGQQFYGFDLVYSQHKPKIQFTPDQFEKVKDIRLEVHGLGVANQILAEITGQKLGMKHLIYNSSSALNRWIACRKKEQIVGYCQYFYEFSEWRNGLSTYVNVISINQNHLQDAQAIIKLVILTLLRQKDGLKITTLRFIFKQGELQNLKKLVIGGVVQAYDVLGMQL